MICSGVILKRTVELWGGIGEKKSNSGRQWYLQDRIYDSDGLAPCLTSIMYWAYIGEDCESKRTD